MKSSRASREKPREIKRSEAVGLSMAKKYGRERPCWLPRRIRHASRGSSELCSAGHAPHALPMPAEPERKIGLPALGSKEALTIRALYVECSEH